jgi:hypothetical protein
MGNLNPERGKSLRWRHATFLSPRW